MPQRQFTYRPRTVDDVIQRQQESENRPGIFLPQYGNQIYKVRNGENWIRILPASWESRHWGLDVWVHGQVGADKATVLCNTRMGLGKCYACELRLIEERSNADEATLRQLNAGHRTVAWLVDRKMEEDGPQLWAMPYQSLDLEIQARSIDKINGSLYLPEDLDNGYDITFSKTGKDLGTRYSGVELVRHPSSIDRTFWDYVIDNPIPECLLHRTYEEVRAMYTGGMDTAAPSQQGWGGRPTVIPAGRPTPQRMPPAAGPVLPPRSRAAPPGYPPSGAPPSRPPAPAARGGWTPPAQRAPAAPPVDNYQGEQYDVDPNYPPPPGEPNYGQYPPQYEPQYGEQAPEYGAAPIDGNDTPPWNDVQEYVQQHPSQRVQLPPRRAMPPQQPPQQPQQPQFPPRGGWAPSAPQQRPPLQRGDTSAAGTAQQLRQHFEQRQR